MILFLALLIPILGAIVLYVWFKHKTTWWEYVLPTLVSLIVIFIFKVSTESYQTSDTEYWSGVIVKAEYYEDWNEYIHQTCYRTVSCGKNCTTSVPYDCSYVSYHPEYWLVTDNNGISREIRVREYKRLVKSFGNQGFVDLRRGYHTNDGDKYISKWGGKNSNLECLVSKHSYENRVQASDDIFNFPDVDTTDIKFYGLYEYPNITNVYKQKNLLGKHPQWKKMNHKLEVLNARLGRKKQLKVFVLLFDGKLKEAAFQQEALWKGGNKNEFVICIGLDGEGDVAWCHPFSWTEEMITKVDIRTFVEEQKKFDLSKTIDYAYGELNENFVRKPFAEFSYLKVDPTGWQIFWTFFITLLVNIGVMVFVVRNDIDADDDGRGMNKNSWLYKKLFNN